MSHQCPECGGLRLPRHPGGLVVDHAVDCTLLAAEDATAAADRENFAPGRGRRHPTTTERTLLAACGVVLAEDAVTDVDYLTDAVRRRTWEGVDLDAETPEPS